MGDKKMGLIYILENKINGRKYVGKTTRTFRDRYKEHLEKDYPIGKALKKYGIENFNKIEMSIQDEFLNTKEVELIKELNTIAPNGYNLTAGGDGVIGQPEEIIEKMRNAKLGTKQTEETKNKRSNSMMGKNKGKQPSLGIHHTEEAKKKISEARKGIPLSTEHKKRLSETHLGKKLGPRSEETKKKIGKSHKGIPLSVEHKKKLSKAHKGKHLTEEHKNKISESCSKSIKIWWLKRKMEKTLC